MRCFTVCLVLLGVSSFLRAEDAMAISGKEVQEMQSFDKCIRELMEKYEMPGGTVAVAKNGRLVYARGFGWANREKHLPMQPDSLLRIASVSKPITATAVLRLVEQGKMKLEDPILPYLKKFGAEKASNRDRRWEKITIDHLLRHTAGFDRDKSFDPMFIPQPSRRPLDPTGIIRLMLEKPLDFDPGEKFAYSNFGYCLLGRAITEVTGKTYEESVRELVLQPAGITRMKLGKTKLVDHAEGEAYYHVRDGAKKFTSVFPEVRELVDEPYGQFYLEALDAHGGWLASSIDLARFASVLDGRRSPRLLKPETIEKIESLPYPAVYCDAEKRIYYGLGWAIAKNPDGKNWFHFGMLAGTRSTFIRSHDGLVMAAIFNGQPAEKGDFLVELDQTLWKAANEVSTWPEGDPF
jgi:N-acyl-D-amino-acid deacylase